MEKEGARATEGFYVVAKADFGRQKQEETLEMSLCRGFLLSVGCRSPLFLFLLFWKTRVLKVGSIIGT